MESRARTDYYLCVRIPFFFIILEQLEPLMLVVLPGEMCNDQCLPDYVELLENPVYKQYTWIFILPLIHLPDNICTSQTQSRLYYNESFLVDYSKSFRSH